MEAANKVVTTAVERPSEATGRVKKKEKKRGKKRKEMRNR